MSRRTRTGFYQTIEYIGPRPQKPKRPHFFGGWVIVIIAAAIAAWYGHPLIPLLKASHQGVSMKQAEMLIAELGESAGTGDRLAAAALQHSGETVVFDKAYYQIDYPGGDIPPGKGAASDVVIRCFRQLGIDLQEKVHEDMKKHFRDYPGLWKATRPDTNIDHRRVENLQRFFERNGQTLPASCPLEDYRPGDVMIWSLADGTKHIGIIVPGPGNRAKEPWVVHNIGAGVKWEDVLLEFQPDARFRYPAVENGTAATPEDAMPEA